jgi:hypothetical protein
MLKVIALMSISLAPAVGGALMYHLVRTRAKSPARAALAVGQIPLTRRPRRAMAVRREVAHV